MCIAVNEWQLLAYTCTAGYKNEKPNDDDDDGFFFHSTLTAIDMHLVSWAINSIFIFILDNDDIFIYVSFSLLIFEHITPYNNIALNVFFFHFGFCYFSFIFAFISLKTNCHSKFSVGRSVGFTLIETIPC